MKGRWFWRSKEWAARQGRESYTPHESKEVAGPKVVRERHPHYRPNGAKKSPAPKVHAATKTERDDFYEALQYFLVEYWEASERLRNGELGVPFPDGCFPPALPFVGDEGRPRAP